jgi:hypothetical protein
MQYDEFYKIGPNTIETNKVTHIKTCTQMFEIPKHMKETQLLFCVLMWFELRFLQFASKNFLSMRNEILVPLFENKSPQT